ncbi:MAG: S9 family peptidase [Bacteroidetes bacterium]|nr:S9 family peptidase [Bacteroidota bacterium]
MKKILIIFFIAVNVYSQSSNLFEPIDVFDLEYVSNTEISPNGNKILYQRNFNDIMTDESFSNIWVINFDGSENRPITTGNFKDNSPKWSNKGDKFVFKSNREGKQQIYLFNIANNSIQKLTNFQYSISSIKWSPDDSYLLFSSFIDDKRDKLIKMPEKPKGAKWNDPPVEITDLNYRYDGSGYRKPGETQFFTVPITGGTPRQISNIPAEKRAFQGEWIDNNTIVFSANLNEDSDYNTNNTEIYTLDINSGIQKALTSREGPDNSPKVSNDNSLIAYLGYDDEYLSYQQNSIYIMRIDGSEKDKIELDLDRNISNIYWSGDDKKIFFQYDDNGITKIGSTTLDGKLDFIIDKVGGLSFSRPYSGGFFSLSKNDRYSFTYGTVYNPADLAVGYKGSKNRLTNLNKDLFDYKKLGNVEEMWYKSSFDGEMIQGWIVKPPNFDDSKKYPLILEIHGGPHTNYGFHFSSEVQLFASKGYVVLYTNPRGSTSYGKEFANLIHHNYPSQDYDDLISGVDNLIERGYIDENNLFVTGGSGGGVLTSWIIGRTDRFAAAVVAKPVINWYSFVLYADNIGYFYKYWFKDLPWVDPESYLKRSPISYVGNVKTPTMVLTGEKDYRTPMAESEQFYAGLKLNKVESMLVRIPNASHGIASKPSNLIAKVNAIISWFEKYKK